MDSTESADIPDVVYRGYQHDTGGSVIAIESPTGEVLGLMRHVKYHSPTGMGWGFTGSGAADCARSLLIAALGEDAARCPHCQGTRKVVFDPRREQDVPFEECEADQYDPELIASCSRCVDGYRKLPHQDFKSQVVASWGKEWRMRRSQALAWLAEHDITNGA
jgi:hypothetical protein